MKKALFVLVVALLLVGSAGCTEDSDTEVDSTPVPSEGIDLAEAATDAAPDVEVDLVDAMLTINENLGEIVDAPPTWAECKVMSSNCHNCEFIAQGHCNIVIVAGCISEGHLKDDFELKTCD